MTQYVIAATAKPWVMLFASPSLEALAEALAAQPTPREMTVYQNHAGISAPLQPKERVMLYEQLAMLAPGDEEAATELAAAYEAVRQDEAAASSNDATRR